LDLSLQVYQSIGNERPKEAIIPADFIDKLYRRRFADLQDELRNKSLQAAKDEAVYSVTLNAALLLASNYKSSQRASNAIGHASHSVFTAPGDNDSGRHRSVGAGVRGRGDGRGNGVICHNCHKRGHVMRHCPEIGNHPHHASVAFNMSDSLDNAICMARRTHVSLGDFDVLLDNQATVSVFKTAALLRDIAPLAESFSIGGLAGDLVVNKNG